MRWQRQTELQSQASPLPFFVEGFYYQRDINKYVSVEIASNYKHPWKYEPSETKKKELTDTQ